MAIFRYTATDSAGRERQGLIEADSSRQARSMLRSQDLFPSLVSPAAEGASGETQGWRRLRLTSTDLVLLTRRWSMLLVSGMSLEDALSTLADQAEREVVREVIGGVRSEIVAGHSLSASLTRFPRSFPALYVGLVRAGEKTGDLATVLGRLADFLESRQEARRRLAQALAYPLLVSAIAIVIIVALMVYVVPTVVAVFVHGKQALPFLTRALIAVSGMVRDYGWMAIFIVAAGALVWRKTLRGHAARTRMHEAALRLPVVGPFWRSLESSRFASTLAILLASGVPLLDALASAEEAVRNCHMREAVARATQRIREGASIARALGIEKAFPALLVQMIANGEASGTLAPMLQRAAEQQQKELDHFTALALAIFEPVLIAVLGVVVLLVVLAVLMPILEINRLVL